MPSLVVPPYHWRSGIPQVPSPFPHDQKLESLRLTPLHHTGASWCHKICLAENAENSARPAAFRHRLRAFVPAERIRNQAPPIQPIAGVLSGPAGGSKPRIERWERSPKEHSVTPNPTFGAHENWTTSAQIELPTAVAAVRAREHSPGQHHPRRRRGAHSVADARALGDMFFIQGNLSTRAGLVFRKYRVPDCCLPVHQLSKPLYRYRGGWVGHFS